jgi:hypothetical protein
MEGIKFKTEYSGLEELAPIQPASNFIPQWFKDMPTHMEFPAGERMQPNHSNNFGKMGKIAEKFYGSTMKRCPAVIDFITEGYIMPYWGDTLIQRDAMSLEADSKHWPKHISFHDAKQIPTYPLKEGDFPHAVKFHSPWYFYTPKNYSLLFIQPFYQRETRFTVLPAIVHTDKWHEVNFPAIIHDDEFTITQGTPFIQIIPFKRSKLSMVMEYLTQKDKNRLDANNLYVSTNFIGGYRKRTNG